MFRSPDLDVFHDIHGMSHGMFVFLVRPTVRAETRCEQERLPQGGPSFEPLVGALESRLALNEKPTKPNQTKPNQTGMFHDIDTLALNETPQYVYDMFVHYNPLQIFSRGFSVWRSSISNVHGSFDSEFDWTKGCITGRDHFARAGCFQPRSLNEYLTNQPTNQ